MSVVRADPTPYGCVHEETWPVLIHVGPKTFDEVGVRTTIELFERQFAAKRRYAVMTVTPSQAGLPDAKARRALAAWADSERVQGIVRERCVASAMVVRNALERGALTAINWLWRPVCPYRVTTSAEDALSYCIEQCTSAGLPFPEGEGALRKTAQSIFRAL